MKKKQETLTKNAYLNIRDAAAHCGVSEGTLRNYISRFPDLPVHRKGIGREGYQIDLKKLNAWRQKTGLLNMNPSLLGREGETNRDIIKKRKTKLEADLLQLKYDREMENVLDKHDLQKMLNIRMTEFVMKIRLLTAIIGKKLGLTMEIIEALRYELEIAIFELLANDEGYFSQVPREYK